MLWLLPSCATVVEPKLAPPHAASVAAKPLSHADCAALALTSAPNAAAFQAKLAGAHAQLQAAKAWPNPTLSAAWENLGLGRMIAEQTMSLGMALEGLLLRGDRVSIAEHEFAAQCAELEYERAKLVLDVHAAYDSLVAARERVVALQEDVRVAQLGFSAARRFASAGVQSKLTADEAAAQLAEAEFARADAEAQARQGEIAFAFALGFERPVALQLSESMTAALDVPVPEQSIERAAAQRLDLKAATERYAAEADRCHLTNARPRFLPTVGGGPRFIGNDTLWVASLDVELPLFDTGAAAIDAQDAALLLSAAELRKTAVQVAADVSLALAEHAAASAHAERHARPLLAMRTKLRQDHERLFAAGEVAFHDMLAAQRTEAAARTSEIDARLRLALASSRMQFAMGAMQPAVVPESDPQVR
jgi:outer membrane protein TolC